ncbi:MAG: hypothetical protein ACLU8F_00540 [Clostridia bacterium]
MQLLHTNRIRAVVASGDPIYIEYEFFHIGLVGILDLFFLAYH